MDKSRLLIEIPFFIILAVVAVGAVGTAIAVAESSTKEITSYRYLDLAKSLDISLDVRCDDTGATFNERCAYIDPALTAAQLSKVAVMTSECTWGTLDKLSKSNQLITLHTVYETERSCGDAASGIKNPVTAEQLLLEQRAVF